MEVHASVRGAMAPCSPLQTLCLLQKGSSSLSSLAALPLSQPADPGCCAHARVQRLHIFADKNARLYQDRGMRTRMWSSERARQGSPIRAVPVQVAHELLNAGHHFLDVRTAEEFAAGHIEGAINIPYMYKVGSGMTKNLNFIEDVKKRFGKDDEVVVGCQMGKRSQMAAAELVTAGFTGVTDMVGGYAAWVQSGKPTKARV